MVYRFKACLIFIVSLSFVNKSDGQIKVIDHKGTFKYVDSSKWSINGTHIFNKNSGNVGIGLSNPLAKFHTLGTLRFESLGTNTTNTNILTTAANGDVSTRSLTNLLDGNAITSLNGLTPSVQSFATGSTGTDFNINSTGSVHTFNIPSASATNRGLLTSTDWTLFNNKENQITAGTTAQYWRGDKTWQTLLTTVVPEGTNLYFTNARARTALSLTTTGSNGAATYNSTTGVFNIPNYTLAGLGGISLTSLSASGPLSYNNTTGAFSISQANGSTNGFLSSSDWTTFNNKIGTINGTTPITASTTSGTTTIGITRNNIVTGTSSDVATNPLVLDGGATNAVIGGANATLTVNNTAPLWNANRLQGRNISTTAPTDGQILTYNNSTSVWEPRLKSTKVIDVYTTSGAQTISNTVATLDLTTERINLGAAYTFATNQITVLQTGVYRISYNAGVNIGSTTEVASRFWLERNTVEITNSNFIIHAYGGSTSCSGRDIIISLSANDVLRIRMQRVNTTNMTTVPSCTGLNIEKLD